MSGVILLSACSNNVQETRDVFAEMTESKVLTSEITESTTGTSAEKTSASITETSQPATSGTTSASTAQTETQTSIQSVTSATESFASSSESAVSTIPPNPGYEDEALKTVTSVPAAVQNALYNYDDKTPGAKYKKFYSKCVFVGDSICRGFKAYDVLPSKQVCAQGNTAARNILEYTFKVPGYTGDLISCLKHLDPEYIVFSMGMNDVNMTSAEKFCENYGYLLSLTEKALPDAQLIVCSVTPVIYGSKFCTNTRIDSFNATLKKYLDATGKWIYADISHGLKDQYNGLKSRYNGGDGIHLSGLAYYAILYQIAERVLDNIEYDAEGNVIHTDAPADETAPETTDVPETKATKKTKKTKEQETSGSKTAKTKKTTVTDIPELSETTTDTDADTTKEP